MGAAAVALSAGRAGLHRDFAASKARFLWACRTFAALALRLQERRFESLRLVREFDRWRVESPVASASCLLPALPVFRVITEPSGFPRLVVIPPILGGDDGLFGYTIESVPEGTLVRVRGEVDRYTAADLMRCLVRAAGEGGPVLLDLSGLDYLDAGCIRVLEDFHAQHTGRLVVIGSRPVIRRLLEITRLPETVPVFHSVDEARAFLRG